MKFGDKLKQLRTERGWTQKELADKLGLAKSTVSLYELSQREPSTKIITQISQLFDVSIDELFDNVNFKHEPKIVLYGSDGKLVDISDLPKEDQEYILGLAEKFKSRSTESR